MITEMMPRFSVGGGDTSVVHGQVTTTAKTETVSRNIIGVFLKESSGYGFSYFPAINSTKYVYWNNSVSGLEALSSADSRITYNTSTPKTVTIKPYNTSATIDYYVVY